MENVFRERRQHKRRPFSKSIRFYLLSNMDYCEGTTVDVSDGGLGMITDHPMTIGDALFFKEDLRVNKIIARFAIVRWVRETENNRYRAGLQFFYEWRV